ncbi:sensor histidine kinase [Halonotius terrestris]|nr:GAF domain-containing sensor histidine kinase [Halonotius terrestris]
MDASDGDEPYKRLCALADRQLTPAERIERAIAIGRSHLGVASGVLSYTAGGEYEIAASDTVATPDAATADAATADAAAGTATSTSDATTTPDAGDDTTPPDRSLAESWCRHVVAARDPVVIADAADSAYHDDIARETTGNDCYLGVPVFVDGELFGTLAFEDPDPRADQFTDDERELAALFADWIGAELQRKRHEADLREQNERLEEFAGIIAHDLRNPLSSAMGYTELAADTASGDQLEFLARVDRSLERMESMIAECLMLAKEGTDIGERSEIALAAVVEDAWETVRTRDATLSVECETTIFADVTRLQQLLENLFRNAVEHGGDGVTVTVADHPDGFVVANDGPPLPADVEAALDDCDTENIKSFGLGLLVVTRVVSGHGWELSVDSGDEGVRFEITGVNVAEPIHRTSD